MERPGIDLKQLNESAMNYFEFNRKTPEPSDVIEWDPPEVNFEFHAGVCVQRGTVLTPRFRMRHTLQFGQNPQERAP
jgi:hypothetical protein